MKYKPFLLFMLTCFFSLALINCFNLTTNLLHSQPHKHQSKEVSIFELDAEYLIEILSKSRAKPTLLMLYASWCKNCIAKFSELKRIINEYDDKINYVIVSLDEDKQKLQSFLSKQHIIDFVPYNVQQQHLNEITHVLQTKNLYFNRRVPYIAILDQEMLPVAQELDIKQVRNYIGNLLNGQNND